MNSKKNSALLGLVASLTLISVNTSAADTFRVENDFYMQQNDISGPGASSVDFTQSFQPFHKHVSTFLTANQAVKL